MPSMRERGPEPPISRESARFLQAWRRTSSDAPVRVQRFDSPLPELLVAPLDKWMDHFAEGSADGENLYNATIPWIGASMRQLFQLPYAAVGGATNAILEAFGVGVTEEEIDGLRQRGDRTRRVTDPTVPLSELQQLGVELTDEETRARNFSRFANAGALAVAYTGRGGLQRAYADGAMAEPETEREQIADFGGQILADMGVTLPFIPLMGVVGRAGVRGAKALAGSRFGSAVGLERAAAATKEALFAESSRRFGADVATKMMQETERLFVNLGIDLQAGMAIGGLHALHALQNGEDMSPTEIAKQIGLFALFGLGFGVPFQGAHAVGIARSRARWQNTILSGPWEGRQIGARIVTEDGRELVLSGKSAVKKDGTRGPAWKDAKTGAFAKAPTPEEMASYLQRRVEEEMTTRKRAATIEEAPPELPGLEERAVEVQTASVAWLERTRQRAEHVSPEVLLREEQTLTNTAADPGLPQALRASLLGRARAIQAVRTGRVEVMPGSVAFETEAAAYQVVQSVTKEEALRIAARAEAGGNAVLAGRIVTMLNDGLPELRAARVEAMLRREGASAGRGLVKGDRVQMADGRQYVLLDEPTFGVATASEIKPKGQGGRGSPEVLDLSEVVIRPKSGTTARLKTGEVVEILEATGGKTSQIKVRRGDGSEATFAFDAVQELGHARLLGRQHRKELLRARQPNADGAQPIPPSVVATPEGEVVTAVAQGPNGTVVRSRSGRTRTVRTVKPTKETARPSQQRTFDERLTEAREQVGAQDFDRRVQTRLANRALAAGSEEAATPRARVEQAMRETVSEILGTATEREVLQFTPGTRPDTDAHILFAAVPEHEVAAFEAAYKAGQPLEKYLGEGVHVLPPVPAHAGVALYALELPQASVPRSAYTPEAHRAVRALQGRSGRLEGYQSLVKLDAQTLGDGQLYRVPEALHARSQRSMADLRGLQGEERTLYLRRLLDMSDEMDSEFAQAATRRRQAVAASSEAVRRNDGAGAQAARLEAQDATIEAIDAATHRMLESAESGVARPLRQRWVLADAEANGALQQALDARIGDDTAWAFQEAHLSNDRDIVFIHGTEPGKIATLRAHPDGQLVIHVVQDGERVLLGQAAASERDGVFAMLRERGFEGGLHRESIPSLKHQLHPYMRAEVIGGETYLYAGETLAGSEKTLWRLDAVRRVEGTVAEQRAWLADQGFVGAESRSGLRLERYTLADGTGRSSRADFRILDAEGTRVGELYARYDPAARDVWVEFVGVREAGAHELAYQPNLLGPAATRELLRQVVREYPDALTVSGSRMSGIRRGTRKAGGDLTTNVTVPIRLREQPEYAAPWVVGAPKAVGQGARPLYGGAIARKWEPGSHRALEEAAAAQRAATERTTWAPLVAEQGASPLTDIPGTNANFGVYGATGQPVRIVEVALDSPEVVIELPDGTTRSVAKSEVQPVSQRSAAVQDYRIAQEAARGGSAYSHRLQQPLGLGALERELGLFGTTRGSIVQERALARADELLEGVTIADGSVVGSPEQVASLLSLYDRSVELGFGKEILNRLPEESRPAFQEAAFGHTRRQIADEPYGLMYAAAKHDQMTPAQAKDVARIAEEAGISGEPHKVIEELWNRRELDPLSAEWTLELRRDLGVARLAEDMDLPVGAAKFSFQQRGGMRWWSLNGLDPTYFVMLKHPMTQSFESSIRHAWTQRQHWNMDFGEWAATFKQQRIVVDGKTRKIRGEDFNTVRDLWQEHGSWEAAVQAKAVKAGDGRQVLFEAVRDKLESALEEIKRLELNLGVEAVRFADLPENTREAFLAAHPWMEGRIHQDFYVLPHEVQRAGVEGFPRTRSTRTPEQVSEFLGYLRRYDSSEQLPAGVTGWQREQFDLWKRFGRDKYWMQFHEGELALEAKLGGEWQLVGFGQNPTRVVSMYGDFVREGRLPAGTEYRMVHKTPLVDEVIGETMSKAQVRDFVLGLKNATVFDGEELAALFVPGGRRSPRPEGAAAGGKAARAPLATRKTDLRPPKDNAFLELQRYWRRIGHLRYRHDVANSYRQFLDHNNPQVRALDQSLSRAEGYDPLFSEGNGKLNHYAQQFALDAAGFPSWMEQRSNSVLAMLQKFTHAPKLHLEAWFTGELTPEMRATLWDTETWETIGGAKQRANDIVAFQALWRMGAMPGTALVNATQYHMYTVPLLQKEFGFEAMWAARGSYWDASKLLLKQRLGKALTPDELELARVAHELGTDIAPGRHMAGAGGQSASQASALTGPVTYGLSKIETGVAWAEHAGMYLFNSAETMNRTATAIAAFRAGTHAGLSPEAALAKARDIMGRSQFWYDELNLPMLMRRGGPAARVLFQFKPFLVNAVRYELDMARGAIAGMAKGDLSAASAMAHHMALFGFYGGAAGLMAHPVLQGIQWVLSGPGPLPDLVPGSTEARTRLNESLGAEPEDLPEDARSSIPPLARQFLLNGAPGLLHLSLGNRLGIAGQDLMAMGEADFLGPHVSTIAEFGRAVAAFHDQEGSQGAQAGLLAGFLLPQFIPGKLGDVTSRVPFARLAMATATAGLVPGGAQWRDFLDNSPEGRRFQQRLLASAMRSSDRAFQLYQHGFYQDVRGNKVEVPYGDRGTEALLALGGFESDERARQRAYLDWLRPEAFRYEGTQMQFHRDAAAAWARGDMERAWSIVLRARELGIWLSWESIERQVENLNTEQSDAFVQQLTPMLRLREPGGVR